MIADQVAAQLGQQFVTPGQRVLDPFCGTGRTLVAAAEHGAECIGVDVNPLATLLTHAKFSQPRIRILEKLLVSLPGSTSAAPRRSIQNLELGRKVEWFSPEIRRELSALISWINDACLEHHELNFVAAILSATVREVSYCRDDQWKLHRIPQEARSCFYKSPWVVFERRLRSSLRDLVSATQLTGTLRVMTGDTRRLSEVLELYEEPRGFDVVITSPPYGDSRTTVQYGAMSAISLGILRHLRGLDLEIITGGEIDRRCLGGQAIKPNPLKSCSFLLRPQHWRGGTQNPARDRVYRFLWDLELCAKEIAKVLRRGGRAVFVIARRSIGGWQLKLDRFLIDAFLRQNIRLESLRTRRIEGKTTPLVINSRGHTTRKGVSSKRVCTMREEYILTFRKA
jgi:SAM-dependent methyltransferase